MSIRVSWALMVPMAVIGCAHNASQSVAATPGASSARSGTAKPAEVIDEGPASASAGAGQLIPFHSSGGFTVLMPANPLQENRTEQTPGGPVQVHVAQARDPSAKYVSTYSEFPPGSLEKVKTPALLDAFQRSTLEAMSGTLVRTRDIQLDGLPGREFTASNPDGSQMTARLLVAPGRVYSLAGTYPQAQVPESVERFLGSFARTPQGGPGVGGSGPASETSSDSANPTATKRPGGAPRGTEVPTGNADPSGPTPGR